MRCLLVTLILTSLAVGAQVPMPVPVTGYFIQARNSSGQQVGALYFAPLPEWICNQPVTPLVTQTVTNPNIIAIRDAAQPDRDCRLSITTWRNGLPPGTRYTAWVGAAVHGVEGIAVAPADAHFVVGIPDFTVVPATASLPAPTGGRLLP